MTLRAADLRFVAPHPVRTAAVDVDAAPALGDVACGLRASGVTVNGRSSGPVDLLVTTTSRLDTSVPARTRVVLGRLGAQSEALPVLVRGEVTRPMALVPLRPPSALRHYLTSLAAQRRPRDRARNRTVSTASRLGVPVQHLVPARRTISVVSTAPATGRAPALVAAAAHLGVPTDVPWVLSLGRGDDLQRAVFHLVADGRPRWVLKFSRVRGADSAFVRDEAGLRLAASAGGEVARHAPVLLGRFDVDGAAASLETAAPGRPLLDLLSDRPLALIDDIAAWIVRTAVQTGSSADALEAERDRLRSDVLPRWRQTGVPPDLVDRIPPAAAVLQHNDLGSWNILSDGHGFTAVDWESARPAGFPLWDLLYFLADALTRIDGAAPAETLRDRTIALFAGRSAHSARLFRWIRTAADAVALPPDAVGPIATLCWLHHGLSAEQREVALAGAPLAPAGHLALMASAWLAEPELGTTWSTWRR